MKIEDKQFVRFARIVARSLLVEMVIAAPVDLVEARETCWLCDADLRVHERPERICDVCLRVNQTRLKPAA